MAESDAGQKLSHEALDDAWIEGTTITICVHVLLQVLLAIFKYQDELRFGVDHVVQAHDVVMPQFFHERNLTDSSRRCALICIQVDLFQGDDFVRRPRLALVDCRICTLAEFLLL